MLVKFYQEVKDTVSVEIYDRFIDVVLQNHFQKTSTADLKRQMTELFADMPSLLQKIPIFFNEIDDEQPEVLNGGQVGQTGAKQAHQDFALNSKGQPIASSKQAKAAQKNKFTDEHYQQQHELGSMPDN